MSLQIPTADETGEAQCASAFAARERFNASCGERQRWLSCYLLRSLAACLLSLCFGGVIQSQILTCPVSSNLTISTDISNVAPSCVVSSGVSVVISSAGTLDNSGPTLGSGILTSDGTINNGGLIQNEINQTITNFGTLINNNSMDIGGGTVTNAGTFDNFGALTEVLALGGTLNNTSTLTNTGSMSLWDNVNNTVGAQLFNSGSISLSSFLAQPFVTTNNGTITNLSGGAISSATPITNNGSFINRGTFTNEAAGLGTGTATFTNNGTVTNFGTFTNTNFGFGGTITNNGTIDNFGSLTNSGLFTSASGATLINESGASLTTSGNLDSQGTLTNQGTITISSSGRLSIAAGTNDGSILVSGGTLAVAPGGTLTNQTGSTFRQTSTTSITQVDGTLNSVPAVQIQGGTLLGAGTINGNVSNTGGVVFGFNTLTINGNYTQGAGGQLLVSLDGTLPGETTLLDVSSLATLDGSVDFELAFGFLPKAGDDFVFLDFGSLSGDFSSIDFSGWSCPTNDTCSIVTSADSMSLDIAGPNGGGTSTPEPASFALLAGGLFAAAVSIRKRTRRSHLRKKKISSGTLS